MSTSSASLKSIRKQMLNLALCDMALSFKKTKSLNIFRGNIFSKMSIVPNDNPNQTLLIPDTVKFNAEYYESMRAHSVPLNGRAIASLSSSARSLDLYSFLAYRLHNIKKPTFIGWLSLQNQFSDHVGRKETFRRKFMSSLKDVITVYPEARVQVVEGGIRLLNSPPPIKPPARS